MTPHAPGPQSVARTGAAGSAPPGTPANVPAAEPPIRALAGLPEETRRALPPLRFGGAVNSPDPKSRMLFVDGQMLREGEDAAPGVRIVQIRLRSVVVDFRGQRVEIPY